MRLHIGRDVVFRLFVPGAPRDCFCRNFLSPPFFTKLSLFPFSSSSSFQQLLSLSSDTLQVLLRQPTNSPSPVSSSSRRRLFIPLFSSLQSPTLPWLYASHTRLTNPHQDQYVPSLSRIGYRPPLHPLGLRLCRFDLCFP